MGRIVGDTIITIDRSKPRQYCRGNNRYFGVSQACDGLKKSTWKYKEADAQRGHDVHQIFALSALTYAQSGGQQVVVLPEYQGYYESIKKWIEKMKPEPVLVERASVHATLPYAGTPDLLAYIQIRGRRVLTLLDAKSGAVESWHRVQVQAYAKLQSYTAAKALGILYLKGDGGLPIHVPVRPNPRDWAAFLSAVNILTWRES